MASYMRMTYSEKIHQATAFIKSQTSFEPRFAIILGTGLGALVNDIDINFEIDYVRVWQKPDNNLLQPAFFGFEGPILYEENERPLKLLPESSIPDDYQKFWLIDTVSAKYFVINKGEYASGVNSLEFTVGVLPSVVYLIS